MAKPLRYISIGLGVALIILGWFVIDSEPVQREAAADVGGLVASRFVDDPGRLFSAPAAATPSAPDALNWRTIIGRAAATTYAAGIACMIFGAGLIGLGVPARGGGRDESMPPPADARPGLLMLGAAGLLLLFGVILAALNGFEGVGSLFGGRSALILAGCGLATLLLRPVRILGLAAYYAGLAAAGLIGLNLARLASRAVLATFLFEDTTFILTASALGMLILFLLIWRAIPGGLNRARLMDQFRRLAAGAGAAAIIAGICIFKSSVLPQQAAADLTDSHHDSGLAGAVLATALEEHGRTAPRALSADEPHPRRAKDEAAPAPAD
ncbi:MAG: hypothetical protein SYC29_17815, partial [Planctomycetota bacterium]|nr:hypothetical protein [Planctomycetota bacterium]